jgi:hypothetical protein
MKEGKEMIIKLSKRVNREDQIIRGRDGADCGELAVCGEAAEQNV